MAPDRDQLRLELKVVLTIVAMIGSVIAAHFIGIASAKSYTDEKVKETEVSVTADLRDMKHDLKAINDSIVRLETLLDRGGRR